MGIAIPMLDLMFFLTENQDNPRHVGATLFFQRPARGGAAVVRQVVQAYRRAAPVPPFNRIPVLVRAGLPEWQELGKLDMDWHVQHLTLPAPDSDAQLHELVAQLHAPMLEWDYLFKTFRYEGLSAMGGDLRLTFSVAPDATRYIGRLFLEMPRRVTMGVPFTYTVQDARDATLAAVHKQHPDVGQQAVNAPMQAR